MKRACALARRCALRNEVPVGAVLVCDGKILARGSNQREQCLKTAAHAEMLALESCNLSEKSWRVPPRTSLYVTIEPCLMCTGTLLWARVENVYFGCADTKNAGLLRVLPLIEAGAFDHRFSVIRGGILEKQCRALISGFFRGKRALQA